MLTELKLPSTLVNIPEGLELITLGAGCFWCTEAVFQRLKGVENVISGYAGGLIENPQYDKVCTGTTGHAEVIQVYFNAGIISLKELLEIFWATHDPTTLNMQGADAGPQYRSCIFYHNPQQGEIARSIKAQMNDYKVFDKPIVTEISAFTNFYQAENYHHDYFNQHGAHPYCQKVIQPKVNKLIVFFAERLK